MTTPITVRLTAIAITSIIAILLLNAWRADRRDRDQLAADLATANQSLTQATARQHIRDAQLQQALAAITHQKASVTMPAQILRELPKEIPLPSPVTLQNESSNSNSAAPPCSSGLLSRPEDLESTGSKPCTEQLPNNPNAAVLPSADLKPLYDFALDCQACQTKLTAAQADLADEKTKTVTLTRERDEAVRVAKGGSLLQRITRAAKWFAIGAAAGALASKSRL